jgi:hypothetical protein
MPISSGPSLLRLVTTAGFGAPSGLVFGEVAKLRISARAAASLSSSSSIRTTTRSELGVTQKPWSSTLD